MLHTVLGIGSKKHLGGGPGVGTANFGFLQNNVQRHLPPSTGPGAAATDQGHAAEAMATEKKDDKTEAVAMEVDSL